MMVEWGAGLGAAMRPRSFPASSRRPIGYVIIIGFGDWGGLRRRDSRPGLPPYQGTQSLT